MCKCLLYFINRFYARSTFIQKTKKVLQEFTSSFTQLLSVCDNNWSVQFVYLTKKAIGNMTKQANREQLKVVIRHRALVSLTRIVVFWNLCLVAQVSLLG